MAELRGRQSFAGLMQRMVAQAEAEGVQRATRRAVARVRTMRSGRDVVPMSVGRVVKMVTSLQPPDASPTRYWYSVPGSR